MAATQNVELLGNSQHDVSVSIPEEKDIEGEKKHFLVKHHDTFVGNNVIMSNCVQLAGEVVIDDFAIVGGGALVHQFCHIGSHVMIQGGALINKDIPPYVKAARNPISYAGINSIGLRRRNFDNETICQIQEIYRILYLSGMNNSDAVERIEAELPATKEMSCGRIRTSFLSLEDILHICLLVEW